MCCGWAREGRAADILATVHTRLAVEYGSHFNYDPAGNSVRIMLMISTSLRPQLGPWKWD